MISLKGCLMLPSKFPVVSHVEYKFRRRPSIIYHNHVQHSHDSHDSMVQVKHSKCCQPFQGLHGNLKTFPELSWSLLCVHIDYVLILSVMSSLYNCFRVPKAAGILRNINQCQFLVRDEPKTDSKLKPKCVKVNGYTTQTRMAQAE